VVFTVRSTEKGDRIRKKYPDAGKLSYVIVEDIAKEGAFDEAVKSNPPFDAVIHTASPFFVGHDDPVKEFLDPAIKGTTGILKAIKAHAPEVKRVVVTSSFAAIVNPQSHAKVYDETSWNPVTAEEALQPAFTYRASKTFAEKAAWDFVEKEKPNFTLTTLCPPLVLGPVIHHLNSLDSINESNSRIRDIVQGKYRDELPPSKVYIWVDVRDLGEAHVKSIELAEAGGERVLVTAGYFSNKRIVEAVRQSFPDLASKLPSEDTPDDLPSDVYGIDNSKSLKVLGLKYRSLKESVADTVKSFQGVGEP
jgi:nucleoside-diphosphate-sugar epimerase